MRCIYRFYKTYDLDLLTLCCSQSVAFTKIIKSALRAYIRGQEFEIKILNDYNPDEIPAKKTIVVDFDETDKDITDWIKSISNGQKNSAVKCVVRHYIKNPIPETFFNEAIVSKKEDNEEACVKQSVNPIPKEEERGLGKDIRDYKTKQERRLSEKKPDSGTESKFTPVQRTTKNSDGRKFSNSNSGNRRDTGKPQPKSPANGKSSESLFDILDDMVNDF